MITAPAPVLLLGDARLRVRSAEVTEVGQAPFRATCATLAATLEAFRRARGFGRAISAPQIGIPLRAIAVNLGSRTFFVVNPVVTAKSEATFTMWDDCMSFPDLLVRLARNVSISLEYVDEEGRPHGWQDLDLPASELLQHEIDHLDGILAVDRALDRDSLVVKAQFDADFDFHAARVDYMIGGRRPTADGRREE
jgi:peptide deformylase